MPALIPLLAGLLFIIGYGVSEDPVGGVLAFIIFAAIFWPVTRGLFGELMVALGVYKSNPWD